MEGAERKQTMGSFMSRPKIENPDVQDDDFEVPLNADLVMWLRSHLNGFPPLLPRVYRRANCRSSSWTGLPFRVMQWNILSQALGTHLDSFVKCPPEALKWNSRRLRLIEEIVTKQPDIICLQVLILAILKELNSGEEILVVTTHLKARKGALLSSLRNEQGKDLIGFLESHLEGRAALICGDFNAEPIEPVYETMLTSSFNLASAYANLYEGQEPPYTTWKIRANGEERHSIDYIFYTPKGLQLEGGLSLPEESDVGPGRVPSFLYPSDHFSLVCDFTLKRNLPLCNDIRMRQ